MNPTDSHLLRYARHIQLTEIDFEGMATIRQAHAVIVGVGGLGSAAAIYLAAIGIGELTLVDDDTVELSNLQRQIIHSTARLGQSKVESARAHLHDLNPDVTVNTIAKRAHAATLNTLLNHADVVLDCSDNFHTRHLLNKACVQLKTPLISGAAIRFEGQISTFDARLSHSPCYACLYPEHIDAVDEPCATLGVFAPLVGIIGSMQAAEALKVIAHIGEPLVGRVLTLDARTMDWQTMGLSRNPDCPVCSSAAK